jgi:hypothetical protein
LFGEPAEKVFHGLIAEKVVQIASYGRGSESVTRSDPFNGAPVRPMRPLLQADARILRYGEK